MTDRKLCPREPTYAMSLAGDEAWLEVVRIDDPDGWRSIYRAMYDAAPDVAMRQDVAAMVERLHWEADNKGLPPFTGWGWLHEAADMLAGMAQKIADEPPFGAFAGDVPPMPKPAAPPEFKPQISDNMAHWPSPDGAKAAAPPEDVALILDELQRMGDVRANKAAAALSSLSQQVDHLRYRLGLEAEAADKNKHAADWRDTYKGQLEQAEQTIAAKDAEISRLKAQVETATAGYGAAVQQSQWQAQTNKELNDRSAELERAREAMQKIVQWADAYPLDIFPEPDFKRARELLEAGGITLDAVSASNMRHVITGVGKIARAYLAERGEKT